MRRRRLVVTVFLLLFSLFCVSNFLSIFRRRHVQIPRQSHLFDNACKFVWTEPLDSTLKKRLKFPKKTTCERHNINLFEREPATGEFRLNVKNYKLDCVVQVLDGGLRPEAHTYQLGRTEMFVPKFNERFFVNADNFLMTCFTGELVVYRKQFMGLQMDKSGKLVVDGSLPDLGENDYFDEPQNGNQFSISILGLDSTSRAQFARHMRKSLELMGKMGGVVFEAYNKVGDNSAVNLLPILADELSETKNLSRLDPTGDINLNKILPSKTPLDPDKIDFLWKQLPPHYVTMFNDDVMHTTRGLFHYPPDNFLGGFTKAPAQFYYRPYYNHLYSQLSNWWRVCLDGDFLAGTFIDSWFRFERTFAKVPHFGFTFISSLTHDDPNNLELLDQTFHDRLDYLNKTGSLENTILIVLGDHGNRVHPLNRFTFAGKIEERTPFLSILAPPRFQKLFPDKYRTLRENAQRFVSNFDLHATLKFLVNLTNNRTQPATRGTSLFEVQNAQKSCQDNGVISNHCLCMIDATQDLYSKEAPNPEILAKTLRDYFVHLNFSDHCLLLNTMKCGNVTETLMPNNYVQVWARTKISDSEVRRKKTKPSPVVYPYLTCHVENTFGEQVEILAQFRLVQATEAVSIVYEPRIRALAGKCAYFSFAKDYCDCIVY